MDYSYTIDEYCDMHLMYGQAQQNAYETRRLYQEKFPQRRLPSVKTFRAVDIRIRETGSVLPKKPTSGRHRENEGAEEQILRQVEQNPSTSTRKIANDVQVSQSKVWRTLHEQGLYPFHLTKIQALEDADFPRRLTFCQWLENKENNERGFMKRILWSDESGFSRGGIFNCHNEH